MTDSSLTIPKNISNEPSLNFELLRTEGIEHIIELGRDIWTDFNAHDPGITMLEVLCYALTDLGYRTNFPIQDLIAQPQGAAAKQHFFSAQDILTCNPVTPNDFRRILIDIVGVKNAWLQKSTIRIDENDADSQKLNGVYDILIELEDGIDASNNLLTDEFSEKIWKKLMAHRNLCEDFNKEIRFVQDCPINICLNLLLENDADANQVKAQILYDIEQFLTPSLPFYSLQEMRDKGKSCEAIFQGTLLEHGFLDEEELNNAQLRQTVYKSDLYQVIMDVKGVKAVREFKLLEKDGSDTWCRTIAVDDTPICKPSIASNSNFYFKKGTVPTNIDEQDVREKLELIRYLNRRSPVAQDLEAHIPKGRYRNLLDYTSIMEEFPLTYRIGEGQLSSKETPLRKAQVKQLQGFLVFFEQILVNYLAQLSEVGNLLAVEQKTNEPLSFFTSLKDQPWFEKLVNTDQYTTKLAQLTNPKTLSYEQRNKLLDHLLARFGEQFSDYTASLYYVNTTGSCQAPKLAVRETLLDCKSQFLAKIDELGRERGKAFNYEKLNCHQPDIWDSENVCGLKKRVSALLCLPDAKRRQLSCPPQIEVVKDINETDSTYRLVIVNKEKKNAPPLFTSVKKYIKKSHSKNDMAILRKALLASLRKDKNGFSLEYKEGKYELKKGTKVLAISLLMAENEQWIEDLKALLYPAHCDTEGFHIVEHILLRDFELRFKKPKDSAAPVDAPDTFFDEIEDPYSFWITVITPVAWPRFKGNQLLFEQVVRRETPAHIGVRILWLTAEELYVFEDAYLNWLYDLARLHTDECQIEESGGKLVDTLNDLTTKADYFAKPAIDTSNLIQC